ncbi:MAG TPA: hypothetical protein VMX33_13255 [bacterium]|nr:hypothetical protein [bacterium]
MNIRRNFSIIAMIALIMASCATAPISTSTSNINSPYVGFADLGSGDYTVLGKVTGLAEVSYNQATKLVTGDTLKYGYLGAMGSAGQTQSTSAFLGMLRTTEVVSPSSPDEKAKANAIFDMIEKSDALGADAVLFVTTKIARREDAGTIIIRVTVSGVAVKLK